jgi:hypothetical protein
MFIHLPSRLVLTSFTLFLACVAAPLATGGASPDKLWQTVDQVPADKPGAVGAIRPARFQAFTADTAALRSVLANAPQEFTSARAPLERTEITLPKPDGTFARFEIEATPVMEPELAAKFPEIKAYRGRGIDDPAASLRLDLNGRTLHAQVLSPSGAYYIDPYWQLDGSLYMSYHKSDLSPKEGWKCHVEDAGLDPQVVESMAATDNAGSGKQLRTYRLALATSIRYSQFHSADDTNPTVPEVMAALVTLVNRVSGIYERELAIRMVLVANNDLLIATVANPQPYTDTISDLEANPTNIDARIGSPNYDIGHVVTLSPGGAAGLGVVCRVTVVSGEPVRSLKARGYTGFDPPVGDPFWVDYVAHEMGHQFAGNHTFNGSGSNCGAANQNPNTAYEPGSGSTDSGLRRHLRHGEQSTAEQRSLFPLPEPDRDVHLQRYWRRQQLPSQDGHRKQSAHSECPRGRSTCTAGCRLHHSVAHAVHVDGFERDRSGWRCDHLLLGRSGPRPGKAG